MIAIENREVYLERMAKPLQEKLRVVKYFPKNAEQILDVGCADGVVTVEMAKLFPETQFLGIDLDRGFIEQARERAEGISNVRFEQSHLRDQLSQPQRYDAVSFISVLHEFYTYGEGISSVLKAMADSHELLKKGGDIIIRDMILDEYTKHATLDCDSITEKIRTKMLEPQTSDFEHQFGKLNNVYKINHFLLKYMYKENWEREGKEHYVPVTFEQYAQMFALLGMKLHIKQSYLLPYLENKWREDFGLTDDEMSHFKSTGILVVQKV